jgi:hypothetical protein
MLPAERKLEPFRGRRNEGCAEAAVTFVPLRALRALRGKQPLPALRSKQHYGNRGAAANGRIARFPLADSPRIVDQGSRDMSLGRIPLRGKMLRMHKAGGL